MSLAPASRRGCFLKARLAVNGIQCAARSLGTLTGLARGLLSSMGASSSKVERLARDETVAAVAVHLSHREGCSAPRRPELISARDGERRLPASGRDENRARGTISAQLSSE